MIEIEVGQLEKTKQNQSKIKFLLFGLYTGRNISIFMVNIKVWNFFLIKSMLILI